MKLEIQSIKDNIVDVQKSVNALLDKPDMEIVHKGDQPPEIIFNIGGSPDMFEVNDNLFPVPVAGTRREPLEEAPSKKDDVI